MQLTHKIWIISSAVLLIAAITIAALYIRQQSDARSEIEAIAVPEAACDLQQGPCIARFPDGSGVTLSIQPLPIQGLKPLRIQVQTEGISAQSMEVDFQGIGMNMGYNRPRLEKQSEGRFTGEGMISVCVLERMHWEATVLAETDQGLVAAPFRFETLRP